MKQYKYTFLLYILPAAFLGALSVFFGIGFRYLEPPWEQKTDLFLFGLQLAWAYVIGLIIVSSNLFQTNRFLLQTIRVCIVGALVCLPLAIQLMIDGIHFSRLILLMEVGLLFLLLMVNGLGLPNNVTLVINILVLAVVIQPSLSASSRSSFMDWVIADSAESAFEYKVTSLHDIKIIDNKVAPGLPPGTQGGAIEVIDSSRLLLVDNNGAFFLLMVEETGFVNSIGLDQLTAPMNRAAYFEETEKPNYNFRVTDMLLEDSGIEDKRTLFIAYHHWDEKEKCVTLNVDEAELDLGALNEPIVWTNRFKTRPCIPDKKTINNQTGGRLAVYPPQSLLLTVGTTIGDELFWDKTPEAVWGMPAEDVSYGKIIEIDRISWKASSFSEGHRNPQGLLVAEVRIWSTEHGPDGGDELNLIFRGRDYGWPASSYGTNYGRKTLAGSDTPGDHSIGERPVYAWVPSIGISRLIKVQGKGFPSWRGDLLVGSLSGRGNGYSLYRVRLIENQIQIVERIRTGQRIRDLVEMTDGQIVTWDGSSIVQTIAPASHVFSECSGCHPLNKGWPAAGEGPNLWGIVGSRVAEEKGFQYSEALKSFGGRWSRQRLDEFLRDPQKVVPGTTMTTSGIEDDDKRKTIIKYLEDVHRKR